MSPSLGLIVGLPLGIAAVVILLVLAGFCFILDEGPAIGFGFIAAALCAGALTAGLMYPWQGEYHHWREVNGSVASISKRLVSSGESSMQERFVLHLADGRVRSCDDSRCSGLKVGDPVTLKCKKHWQFAGTDGWDCNWAGKE